MRSTFSPFVESACWGIMSSEVTAAFREQTHHFFLHCGSERNNHHHHHHHSPSQASLWAPSHTSDPPDWDLQDQLACLMKIGDRVWGQKLKSSSQESQPVHLNALTGWRHTKLPEMIRQQSSSVFVGFAAGLLSTQRFDPSILISQTWLLPDWDGTPVRSKCGYPASKAKRRKSCSSGLTASGRENTHSTHTQPPPPPQHTHK